MKGNSLRLRLTRSEVAQLSRQQSVRERVEFGKAAELIYELESRSDLEGIVALFRNGVITISVPVQLAQEWAAGDSVGMEKYQDPLTILIEKDFQCAHGEKDPEAYQTA